MRERPASELRLWGDILDTAKLRAIAARAPRFAPEKGATTADEAFAIHVHGIVEGQADGSDVDRLLGLARLLVGKAVDGEVYQRIDQLARMLGADFENLKRFLIWKGLVKQGLRRPSASIDSE